MVIEKWTRSETILLLSGPKYANKIPPNQQQQWQPEQLVAGRMEAWVHVIYGKFWRDRLNVGAKPDQAALFIIFYCPAGVFFFCCGFKAPPVVHSQIILCMAWMEQWLFELPLPFHHIEPVHPVSHSKLVFRPHNRCSLDICSYGDLYEPWRCFLWKPQ